ncbi:choice-of-anchor tandem repeat GloVer-containing protein [Flammeovirga sp. EKP202]|uniref:choice-of-anchor tandem repeat GloVer-containing protein n=1 Tax=Flammeovirga sp. EKP202 TaxID=2770592 RepID=UPI00165F6E46|nr:choice-of-anchor tandem repeat GloVer-containing protein [Flammeovirga sp. EKP202]MBD0403074.1 T9SS type A sorting domain-containing protein [Flammeovirga sp. EKP202]
MNTNSSGGIQNAGGISIYNLSSPAGTPPEFYDHGESFTGQPGDFSSLILASDGYIYGHTEGGGENYSGIFFRIDPATNTVTQLFSFDYNNHFPIYNMVEHNQVLYGVMRRSSREDVVFAIKLSDPTHLIALTNLTDRFKIKRLGGGFYKLNNKLYATIFDGLDGSNIVNGGVYEYDLSTGNDRILCSSPYGYILSSGALSHRNVQGRDRLIVANSSSPYGAGGFYEVDAESGFIHEISVVRDRKFKGSKFSGVFRNSSGDFYSRSFEDGSAGVGTLVSILPDDKKVTKEFTLTPANGTAITNLVPNGHDLIGMTQPFDFLSSGPNRGVIYQIDRHGNYKELYHFKDMSYPSEFFIITNDNGGTVWGIAGYGGKSNQGAIFKYEIATNKMEVIANFGSDTGFVPETRLTSFKDGKYTFSNRDGGIKNGGTLASFDPSTGAIGHLYATGNNSLAKQGYSNGAFLASNGKYYAIERTRATAYDIYKDSLFYRDRLVQFNDDLDSVTVLTARFKNRINETNEYAPYNVIGEIIEIQGKLVFTYTNRLYTYDLSSGQFTELLDLHSKRNVDNSDAAWDWGELFSTAVTKKDDNTYYYATQGSGEVLPNTHCGTILKLDVSTSPWTISHEYTIDPLTSNSAYRSRIQVRSAGRGGVGVKGRMLILPGTNSDPDTLVLASEYNSPTTLGCILAYPMGENGNRIGTTHIIKEFPETGFDPDSNTSANDSTDGWFPMADLAYYDNKIYGFTKGGLTGSYTSADHGAERGTAAFNGTFWSIDRANANAFELLYTLEESTGISPLLTSTDIIQLAPISGNKLNADTLGCAITTRTFKVYGYNRGTLQWWSSNSNVTLVPSMTNADSATFDFSNVPANLEQTTTISVAAYNPIAASAYQYGDTLLWDVHQYVQPSIGNIVSSVDLHCPVQHARLTLSSYTHVDSFYWEIPTDIVALTSVNDKDEIQIDLSREDYGMHQIICHAFNGCGEQVSDTLSFELVDPNYDLQLTSTASSTCTDGNLTFSVTTPVSGQTINWTIPNGAYIVGANNQNATSVEVDFSGVAQGSHQIIASVQASCNVNLADTTSIDIHTVPSIHSLSANRALSCDDEIVSFIADVDGAESYQWTFPNDAILISGQGTKLVTLDMSDIITDSVQVNVTIGNSCNVNISDSIQIAVPRVPTVSGIDISDDIIHPNDTVSMTASNVMGGVECIWTLPQGAQILGADNEETIQFTVRESNLGDHNVGVQAVNNCGASTITTAVIRIEFNPNSIEKEYKNATVVYPNPSKGELSLVGIEESLISIVVRDINGRIVKKYQGEPKDIQLNKLGNGKYFMDVFNEKSNYGIHSIIIQK